MRHLHAALDVAIDALAIDIDGAVAIDIDLAILFIKKSTHPIFITLPFIFMYFSHTFFFSSAAQYVDSPPPWLGVGLSLIVIFLAYSVSDKHR